MILYASPGSEKCYFYDGFSLQYSQPYDPFTIRSLFHIQLGALVCYHPYIFHSCILEDKCEDCSKFVMMQYVELLPCRILNPASYMTEPPQVEDSASFVSYTILRYN